MSRRRRKCSSQSAVAVLLALAVVVSVSRIATAEPAAVAVEDWIESTSATASAADQAPLGLGNFRALCEPSHLAYDDPIVAPGKPGTTHLHLFFGNDSTNAWSTHDSLRTHGGGTCSGGPLNRSAYWAPAVLTPEGKVVMPNDIAIYYKNGDGVPSHTTALPAGLRMIAGFDMSNPTGVESGPTRHWDWYCSTASQPDQKGMTIPNCPAGEDIIAQVRFPSCWDGINLDSANHRSHLAHHSWDGSPFAPLCPASHPVVIPEFTITFVFPNRSPGESSAWRLSSDSMPGMSHPNGSTLHADWFGAWEPSVSDTWLRHCIRGLLDCSTGDLGNRTRLIAPRQWAGGTLVTAPSRMPTGDYAPPTTPVTAPVSVLPPMSIPEPGPTNRPPHQQFTPRSALIKYSASGVAAPSPFVSKATWRTIVLRPATQRAMRDPYSAATLRVGGYIARVQRLLKSGTVAGPSRSQRAALRVTGVMDLATARAVRAFQRSHRSVIGRADGAIDWSTVRALGLVR